MNCPNCDNVLQQDAMFCDQCGQRLDASAAEPERAQGVSMPAAAPGGSQVTHCPGCGSENLPGELFCAECGTPLEAPTPMEMAPSEQMDASTAESRLGENDPTATKETERADVPVDLLGPSDPDASPEGVSPPGGPAHPGLPMAPADTVSDDEARASSCMACGAEVRADDAFCFACGARLDEQRGGPLPGTVLGAQTPEVDEGQEMAPEQEKVGEPTAPAEAGEPTVEPAEAAPTESVPDVCPSCGASVNPGDLFCDACGVALSGARSAAAVGGQRMDAPEAAAADMGGEQPFLVIAASGVEIPLPQGTEVLVGREDPYSNVFPDVDLSPHDGEEAGVSRRHFKLTLADGRYAIQDLGATNYTWVNQQRLEPDTPQRLADGDEIRAGRLKMIFRTRL